MRNYLINTPAPLPSYFDASKDYIGFLDTVNQSRKLQAEAQEAQRKAERNSVFNARVAQLAQDPNPKGIQSLMIEYPEFANQLTDGLGQLKTQQRERMVKILQPAHSALLNNRPDLAIGKMQETVRQLREAGEEEEADQYEASLKDIEADPKNANMIIGGLLAASMGVDKYGENYASLQESMQKAELFPNQLLKAQEDAQAAVFGKQKAETEAGEAISKKKIKDEEAKDIADKLYRDKLLTEGRIRATDANRRQSEAATALNKYNLEYQRETAPDKKALLGQQLQTAKYDYDKLLQDEQVEYKRAQTNIDNALSTAQRLLETDNQIIGWATGSIKGQTALALPRLLSDDVAAFVRNLETLNNQNFLAQLPQLKGFGALSNTDREALVSSVQNLSTTQGKSDLVKNIKEVIRVFGLMRQSNEKTYEKKFGKIEQKLSPLVEQGQQPVQPKPSAPIPVNPLTDKYRTK